MFQSSRVPKDETERLLLEYISQCIRWAKREVEQVCEDVQSEEVLDKGKTHFDFNEDVVIDNDYFHKEVKGNGS